MLKSNRCPLEVMIRMQPPASELISISNSDLHQLHCGQRIFHFDHIFEPETTQQELFHKVGVKLAMNTLDGYNSCLFVYGQTGTGKTYTMTGVNNDGLVQRTLRFLWRMLNERDNFKIKMSYLEVYNETVYDLFQERRSGIICQPIPVRHDIHTGFYAENLREVEIQNETDFECHVNRGLTNRTTKATKMNEQSSRSHSVITVQVQMKQLNPDRSTTIRSSKINFVDLAGSQKQKLTAASGVLLKEASNINKSLTQLSIVISKLAENLKNVKHIPYRDSTLTKLLKDSLQGNAKTILISTVSSKYECLQQTISTLLFAEKAKKVQIQARVNQQLEGNSVILKKRIKQLEAKIIELESLKHDQLEQSDEQHCPRCQQMQKQIRQLENKIAKTQLNTQLFLRSQQPNIQLFLKKQPQSHSQKRQSFSQKLIVEVKQDPQVELQLYKEELIKTTQNNSVHKRSRKNELMQIINQLEIQLKSVTLQRDQYKRSFESFQNDNQKYDEIIAELGKNIKNLDFSAAQKTLLMGQSARIEMLEGRLSQNQSTYAAKITMLEQITQQQRTTIQGLSQVADQYRQTIIKSSQNNEHTRNTQRQTKTAEKDIYVKQLERKLTILQEQSQFNQSDLIKAATMELVHDKENLLQQISDLKIQIEEQKTYSSILRGELDKNQLKIQDSQQQFSLYGAQISNLQEQLKEKDEQILQLKNTILDQQMVSRQISQTFTNSKAFAEKYFERQVNQKRKIITKLQSELQTFKTAIGSQQTLVEATKNEVKQLKQELRKKSNDYKFQKEQLNERLLILTSEQKRLKQQVATLYRQIEVMLQAQQKAVQQKQLNEQKLIRTIKAKQDIIKKQTIENQKIDKQRVDLFNRNFTLEDRLYGLALEQKVAIEESSRVKEENYRLMNRLSYAKRLTSEKETEFQTKIQYLNDKISRLEKLDARKQRFS